MRYRTLTLAVVALFAFSTGGIAAVTATDAPTESPLPTNTTVDVVDSDDRLRTNDVDTAQKIAVENETVREQVSEFESAHVTVWAPQTRDDEVSVWISKSDDGPTALIADVDLANGTVVDVRVPVVKKATHSIQWDTNTSEQDTDEGVFHIEATNEADSGTEMITIDTNESDLDISFQTNSTTV